MADNATKEYVISARVDGSKVPSDLRKIENNLSTYSKKFQSMFAGYAQMPALKEARANAQTRSEKWVATHNITKLKKEYSSFISSKVKQGPSGITGLYGDGWRIYKPNKTPNAQSFGGKKKITSKDLDLADKIGNAVGKSFGYDTNKSSLANKIDAAKTSLKALSTKLAPFITIAEKVLNVVKKVGSAFLRTAKNIGKTAIQFVKSRLHLTNLAKKLKNFEKALIRVVTYKAIRTILSIVNSGLKEGINNLYKFSTLVDGRFKSTMDGFATSWLYVQNAIGAFVGTVLDAVMPAINVLLDKVAEAANMLAKFSAALLGTGYYKATKQVQKYSDMVASAASNQKQLFGFDELNVLSNTGASASSMFINADEEVKAFGSVEDAIDSITKKINSLVDGFDIESFAERIGKGINKIVKYFNTFMDRVNFEGIGTKLAKGLDKLINTISPQELGKAFTQKINMVADLIKGFVENFGWGEAGKWLSEVIGSWISGIKWGSVTAAISGTINGLFEFAREFIAGTDWPKKAEEIADHINAMIKDIDTEAIGNVLSQVITTIFESAKAFLSTLNWESIGAKVAALIEAINWTEVFNGVIEFVWGVFKGVLQAFAGGISYTAPNSKITTNPEIYDPGYLGSGQTSTYKYQSQTQAYRMVHARASGGSVDTGSLFLAGEAGPELVTKIGGKSTVYNEQQLGASMAYANEGVISAINNLISVVRSKDSNVVISASDIRRAVNSSSMRVGV